MNPPSVEASGDWLSALQDHGIEARLGDDSGLLLPSWGVHSVDTLFVFIEPRCDIARIGDVHGATDIGQHPPRSALEPDPAAPGNAEAMRRVIAS
jgi:hypothetical protein